MGKTIKRKKITGEHPCRSAISIKLQSTLKLKSHFGMSVSSTSSPAPLFAIRGGRIFFNCSGDEQLLLVFPVNLLHIFRTPFLKNTSRRLLLIFLHFSFSNTYKDQYQGNKMRYTDFLTLLSIF